jgi:hypothetical protein
MLEDQQAECTLMKTRLKFGAFVGLLSMLIPRTRTSLCLMLRDIFIEYVIERKKKANLKNATGLT